VQLGSNSHTIAQSDSQTHARMIAQCGDKIAVYESEAILRMDGNFIGSVNGEF